MTKSLNQYPYYDNFDEANGYYEILFRPGRAVQARELSQIQSTLQNQIRRFGQNIFKEGSMVIPGASALNVNYPFIKLDAQFNGSNIAVSNFVGKKIIGSTSGAVATVLQGVDVEGVDPATLYLQFQDGAASQTFDAQITLNSVTIAGLSDAAMKSIVVGSTVTGTGISAATYVTSIVNSSSVTINNASTITNPTASLNFSTSNVFQDGENINTIETIPFYATLASSDSTGIGSAATIQEGVYFVNGYFVFVDTQTILLDKYDSSPSFNVGLTIVDSFVNSAQDASLVDPANRTLNANAPGADRYKISLDLTKYAIDDVPSSNFIQLIQVKDGIVQSIVTEPQYSEIEKALAREFYDANGNYYVKKFPLTVREDLNDGTNNGVLTATQGGDEAYLDYAIGPGKAYVLGYPIKTLVTKFLKAPKARTTIEKDEIQYNFDFGNYVEVTAMTGTFDTTTFQEVNLNNDTDSHGGSTVGTAKVRELIWVDGTIGTPSAVYRLYLFDVAMDVGHTFSEVKSIRVSSTMECDLVLDSAGDNLGIKESDINNLLLPINEAAIATLRPTGGSTTLYSVRRFFSGTMSGTTITFAANANEYFAPGNAVNYHVSLTSTGEVIDMQSGGNSIVLSGSPAGSQVVLTIPAHSGAAVRVIATLNKTNVTQKTKTLTSASETLAQASVIQLAEADIYTVNSIIDVSIFHGETGDTTFGSNIIQNMPTGSTASISVGSTITGSGIPANSYVTKVIDGQTLTINNNAGSTNTGTSLIFQPNIAYQYALDDGQRDNYYLPGSLKFNTAYAAPSGNVVVNYQYFAHGTGDFFSVDSYSIPYAEIPNYISGTTGNFYSLVNCMDFRPRYDGSIDSHSNPTVFTVYSELPTPTENITFDYASYLGRIDLVFLDSTGTFSVIQGSPSDLPSPPNHPENGMVLYQINVPPYTFDTKNISVISLENRGFTMADIAKVVTRVENLEQIVAMNALEQHTNNFFIPDAAGNNAFKNGFLVDNFSSHLVGAVDNTDYQCSIDTVNGVLRPAFAINNLSISFDEADSTNYQKTGDLITLPYTSQSLISQLLASSTISVNPYAIYNWIGNLQLSPNSDDWFDTTTIPQAQNITDSSSANTLASANATSFNGQVLWGKWKNHWVGIPITSAPVDLTTYTGGRHDRRWLKSIPPSTFGAPINVDGTLAPWKFKKNWSLKIKAITSGSVTSTVQTSPGDSTTVGNQVVSTTEVPFMRARDIAFSATGMKPNTKVYPFFDNTPVSAYCTPTGGSLGGNLITDITGKVSGTFSLPSDSTTLQFHTGTGVFALVDNQSGDVDSSETSASAQYIATGTLQTNQTTLTSTQLAPNVQVTTSSSTTSLVGTNIKVHIKNGKVYWADPLSQSFLINTGVGAFLTKIDVYFSSIDAGNIPVTLQIRDMVNGYPGPNIVPFSTVTLDPSSITISSDGSIATSFVFSSPVYLNDGTSYCFVLMSNSNAYRVFEATLGESDLVSQTRISKAPYNGAMFESQNGETWIANPSSVMKFNIWSAQFSTTETSEVIFNNDIVPAVSLKVDPFTTTASSSIILVYQPNHGLLNGQKTTIAGVAGTQNGLAADNINGQRTITLVDFDHYTIVAEAGTATASGACGGPKVTATTNIRMDTTNINIQNLSFPQSSLTFNIKTLDANGTQSPTYTSIPLGSDVDFFTSQLIENEDNETTKSVTLQATFSTSDPNVSPVIDTSRMSMIVVSNRINYVLDSNGVAKGEDSVSGGDALARYITGNVTLTNPSNNLDIVFNALRPPGADIQIFAKIINAADQAASITDATWVKLDAISYPGADADLQTQYEFKLTDQPDYTTFSIKIVMLSDDTAEVPQITSFRGIAT